MVRDDRRPGATGSLTVNRWVVRFERRLRPRNRCLGEVSEGAAEAPSEKEPQIGPDHRSSASPTVWTSLSPRPDSPTTTVSVFFIPAAARIA